MSLFFYYIHFRLFIVAHIFSHHMQFFYKLIWFHIYSQRSSFLFFAVHHVTVEFFLAENVLYMHMYIIFNIWYLKIFCLLFVSFCSTKTATKTGYGMILESQKERISRKKNIDMVTIKNKNQLILNHFFLIKFHGTTISICISFIFNDSSLGFHGSKWNANNSYPIDYYYCVSELLK